MKKVLISGGSGLVGKHLCRTLQKQGYEPIILSRNPKKNAKYRSFQWSPKENKIAEEAMGQYAAIINLAGENVGEGRWTKEKKERILKSRQDSAATFYKYLKEKRLTTECYISPSGINHYGDTGDEWMQETDPAGKGFLAVVTQAWEAATAPITNLGIRTIIFRIGVVLANEGGAFPKMLVTTKVGVSSYFGDGKQYMSWIHIQDLCKMICYAIENKNIEGVYNAIAPNPVSNKKFAKTISNVYGGILVPAPAFALKLVLGEQAAIVLEGTRATSAKIQAQGFQFEHSELSPTLQALKKDAANQ